MLIFLLIISIIIIIFNWKILNKTDRKHMLTLIIVILLIVYYQKINQSYDIKIGSSGILIRPKLRNCSSCSKTPSQNRSVSSKMKKIVASGQQWKCLHCHNMLDATYEIDHKLPLYKGGTNDRSNLQALCRNCHGNKTLEDSLN